MCINMNNIEYLISRKFSINGEKIEITLHVDKEKVESKITTKRTLTDDEGMIWDVTKDTF